MRRFVTRDGFRMLVGGRLWKWWRANYRRLHGLVLPPTTMYDSVTIEAIPLRARAVAGYVGGQWPTYPQLVKRWPNAQRLSIAVAASEDADCLDVEKGDATPLEAPGWVKRQHARVIQRPVVYSSIAQMQSLLDLLAANGILRSHVRVWTAHYRPDLKPHRCTAACGFGFTGTADATQYTDKAQGRNLDASRLSRRFFR